LDYRSESYYGGWVTMRNLIRAKLDMNFHEGN
jgi:hypothetical protein